MAKTLNELARSLKEFIVELNSDAHNKTNFRPERYHNLKLSMDVSAERFPHVVISVGMSEAMYNLTTLEKVNGSLGVDERFAQKWFDRAGVIESLRHCWKERMKIRGTLKDLKEDDN